MSAFDPKAAENALIEMRKGYVPSQFCGYAPFPLDAGDVDLWASNDQDFAAKVDSARRIGADALVAACIAIADSVDHRADTKKIMIDTRMKIAALYHPDKYGTKTDKTPTSSVNFNVHVPFEQLTAEQQSEANKYFGCD